MAQQLSLLERLSFYSNLMYWDCALEYLYNNGYVLYAYVTRNTTQRYDPAECRALQGGDRTEGSASKSGSVQRCTWVPPTHVLCCSQFSSCQQLWMCTEAKLALRLCSPSPFPAGAAAFSSIPDGCIWLTDNTTGVQGHKSSSAAEGYLSTCQDTSGMRTLLSIVLFHK